jgi:hypothetical protein
MIGKNAIVLLGLPVLALTGSAHGAQGLQKSKDGVKAMVDGVQQITQGAKNAIDAKQAKLEEQQAKFVDVAGNVYDVLRDTAGQATKFVVDSTGAVVDSTKLIGGFLFDAAMSYPGDLAQGLQESREEVQQYIQAGADAAQQLGQIAMNSRPELPEFKQMLKPHAWAQAAKESGKKLTGAFGELESQLVNAYEDIESEFCVPPRFKPHMKVPGKLEMPSFYIEAGLGECTLTNLTDTSQFAHADGFNCTKPYVKTEHKPGSWISKHHSAIRFKSKECKKEKEFGEEEKLVLFEFDGHSELDLERVRGVISGAFGGLVDGVQGLTGQVEEFVSSMKDVGGLKEKLGGLGDLGGKYGQLPAAY